MRTWWNGNSSTEVLRLEKLALVNKDCKRYRILTFSSRRVFSSSVFC